MIFFFIYTVTKIVLEYLEVTVAYHETLTGGLQFEVLP